MLIDRACEITMIRMSELPRVSLTALEAVIRDTKSRPETDFTLSRYTKAEQVEAYETIKAAVKRGGY